MIRLDVVDQLQVAGFEVFEAAHADEAISILNSNPTIRLLFTDVHMPGTMDGLKLAAAVRDRWPPVKIVVTSGHRVVEELDLPTRSVFHNKPYRHNDVLASMLEMLT